MDIIMVPIRNILKYSNYENDSNKYYLSGSFETRIA